MAGREPGGDGGLAPVLMVNKRVPNGAPAQGMLIRTGFSSIDGMNFPHDVTNDYIICRL